jgi:hypothetical protein
MFISVWTSTPRFDSQIVNAASGLLAIAGIVLAYVFYRRSRKVKQPCWSRRNNSLIEGYANRLMGLEVLYNNQRVENLSVARFAFWNKGSETIHRSDIKTANPLRISPTDASVRILDVKLLARNHESSQFVASLDADRNAAMLDFDYLDRNCGAVIQVIHTGTNASVVEVAGDIKGVKRLTQKYVAAARHLPFPTPSSFDRKLRPSMRRKITGAFFGVFGLIFVVPVIFKVTNPSSKGTSWGFVMFAVIYCLSIWCFAGLLLRTVLPSGLEIFEDQPGP